MAKIINYDFKKKHIQYTWTDDREEKIELINKLHKKFIQILDTIVYITDDDIEYKEYVAKQLGNIMNNLHGRL